MDTPLSTTPRGRPLLIAGAAAAMQAAVWALMYGVFYVAKVGYDFFYLADSQYYFDIARRLALGMMPYRDFTLEYPPLFVPLVAIPRALGDLQTYLAHFAVVMVVFTMAAAVLTALAARELWPKDARRPFVVAALMALAVLAAGPLMASRYDAVVAFLFAGFLFLVARGHWEAAAVALGLGFALKITPVFVLPVLLVLAPRRRAVWSLLWFTLAATLPFLPYLLAGSGALSGLGWMLQYHLSRPLEIESVLGTPLLLRHMAGGFPLTIVDAAGSQTISAAGTDLAAAASGPLVLAALAGTYWLVWRRRALMRADARLVPFAVLAVMIASMALSKVLSPQYFIWLLPALALAAPDRRTVGGLLFGALALTQVEFPANYWAFVDGDPRFVALVTLRNVLLVAAAAVAWWQLYRLPAKARRTR